MYQSSYLPSFDFRLFELPQFSPLQAQEFGAETFFRANDPTWFVDASLAALTGALPLFQDPSGRDAELEAQRARAEFERAKREAERAHERIGVNIWDILRGRTARSGEGTGPILGSGANQPGDASVGDDPTHSGQKAQAVADWWKALPAGSGVFLIAVVAIIFLLLFVRR